MEVISIDVADETWYKIALSAASGTAPPLSYLFDLTDDQELKINNMEIDDSVIDPSKRR